ncbi:MAG: hypothetical protein AB7P07_12250 [Hyphomonadaceae bacterium]
MRPSALIVIALALAACGQRAPHDYPAAAKAHFESTCPPESEVCRCTWDEVTRTVAYEEYEAALQRYRVEGLMDPRITRARTNCLQRFDN